MLRSIEVKPGCETEWLLVRVQAGTFNLQSIVPGHVEAGMVDEVTVEEDGYTDVIIGWATEAFLRCLAADVTPGAAQT